MNGLKLVAHKPRGRIKPLDDANHLGHKKINPMAAAQMLKLVLHNHFAG